MSWARNWARMKTLFLTLFVAHQKPLIFELLHYCWSSKLCYDFLPNSLQFRHPPSTSVSAACACCDHPTAPACPVSACFGSFGGRERRVSFMWSVSHVLLCEPRAALREHPPLTAPHALLCTSSADGFPGSQGPCVFSVSFNVCTPIPCSSNEVRVVYFLCCPALKV